MRASLRTRILAAFGLTFALFLGATVYSTWQLRSLGGDISLVNQGYLPLARVATRVESFQDRIDLDVARLQRDSTRPLAAFRSNTALHTRRITAAVAQGRSTTEAALEKTRRPEEREALLQVAAHWSRLADLQAQYEEASNQWVSDTQTLDPTEDAALQADLVRRQKEMQATAKQLSALLDTRIREVNERIARAQARATAVAASLALAALAFGLGMAAWTLVTLRPISRFTQEAQRVAAGDYSGRIDVTSNDEIGVLAREFNSMAIQVDQRDRRLSERAEELKRLSQYLQSVVDTISLGLVAVEEGRVTMANPAAAAMWSLDVGGDLPAGLADLSPGAHVAWSHGSRRYDVQVVPFGSQGRLVVTEDVTRRIQDQDRLARSERLALVGQMLAQICHEVRNPLNAISLNAELLGEELVHLDPGSSTESREILATISQEILRLEGVTEHYLDLARRPAPTLLTEAPGEIVQSVCRLEERAFHQAGIQLEVDIEPDLPAMPLDGNQLRRAFLNVLSNTLHTGAARVRVSVRRKDETVEVQVQDDGRGMDPETRDRAFEPFFSRRSRGTGLGLAIARQVVEDHDGQITCESRPGEGCRMTLVLPIRVLPRADEAGDGMGA